MKKIAALSVLITLFLAQSIFSAAPPHPKGVSPSAQYLERPGVWVLNEGGHQVVWFKNGIKKAEGKFVDRKRSGTWSFWFPNGKPRAVGDYRGNLKHGAWKFYDEKSGSLREEGEYRNNKKEGKWTRYYPSGATEVIGHYRKGKKEGEWTNYYENGKIFYKGSYADNEAQGKWSYYFEGGETYQRGEFRRGVRIGEWYICIFPKGPCSTELFASPSTPRTTGLPPADENGYGRDSSNPAEVLDSMEGGAGPWK